MRPRSLPDAKVVAVDTETSGLHRDDGARVACVSVAWDGGSASFPFDQGIRDKLPTWQGDLFEDDDPNLDEREWSDLLVWLTHRRLVFHNAKFDLAMLRAGTRHWLGLDLMPQFYYDTMLASGVLEPREPRGLDAAAARAGLEGKAGLDAVKVFLKKHKLPPNRYDLAPWDVVEPYVTTDAELTIGLYQTQQQLITEGNVDRLREEFDLTRVLYGMEARGVEYDAEGSLAAAEELERRVARIRERMPFDPSINKAKAYFFGERGLVPDRRTEKKGLPVLDQEQVRKWKAEGVEWAAEYLEVAQAERAVSMWYRAYPEFMGTDGRLRTVYKQGSVKSGRMSVERVQLQALPKGDKIADGIPHVRDLVRAPEGKALWNLDLVQAELRVATKYADCKRMAELLEQGADIHGITTEEILGVSRDAPDWKLKRDIGKRLTFSAIFQIGPSHFQEILSKMTGIVLPLEECERYVHNWRRQYPEFERAYYRSLRKARRDHWVRLLYGSEYETKGWFARHDGWQTAWNRTVQGSLAEAFKKWLIQVERDHPGLMVLTVHDSVLLEAPVDEGQAIAESIAESGAELMRSLFDTDMPIEVSLW